MAGTTTATKGADRTRNHGAISMSAASPRAWRLGLRVLGAALLFASGAIHLDLYVTGYRTIPTIGALFLLQIISAFALGVVVLLTGGRVVSAGGAGLAISTLAGYVVSLRVSLFGFREVRTIAGVVAGIVEVCAFAALAALAMMPQRSMRSAGRREVLARMDAKYAGAASWTATCVTIFAAVLLFVPAGDVSATPTKSSGHQQLGAATIGGTSVVTNPQGLTLYWFVPDTQTTSACNGTCAIYWPPLTGSPAAGTGVTGTLGSIHRTDGTTQVTYDGHPLYTYIGDNAPGQATGNNINLNGGVWHEMAAGG